MEIIEKSFNDCTLVYLEKTFGLQQIKTSESLNEWFDLAQNMTISDFEAQELALCQDLLIDNILHWNEQELSLHFIGPVLSLVRFTSPQRRFNLFAERPISSVIENIFGESIRLSGKPDGLIASGYREPESPFFCFTEYKKHREPTGEPEGQCLASLLAGQILNAPSKKPMYGCFVIGRDWYFMTLVGNKYSISQDFSAATADAHTIFKTLKALKEIVERLTA